MTPPTNRGEIVNIRFFIGKFTMRIAVGFMLLIAAVAQQSYANSAWAACLGSASFQTCSDSSGNSYNVQRFGNSTYMQGYSARTGSNWSQNSQTFGNSTYTQGRTNGRSWNMQQHNFGNGTSYSGTDSYGRAFSGFNYGR